MEFMNKLIKMFERKNPGCRVSYSHSEDNKGIWRLNISCGCKTTTMTWRSEKEFYDLETYVYEVVFELKENNPYWMMDCD